MVLPGGRAGIGADSSDRGGMGGFERSTLKEWPARERPRERLREVGAAALSATELVAILVGSGTEGRSAMMVAGELLRLAGGSLRRLAAASPAELAQVRGRAGPATRA
jgi:DNA repair protein RadC